MIRLLRVAFVWHVKLLSDDHSQSPNQDKNKSLLKEKEPLLNKQGKIVKSIYCSLFE